MNKKSQYINFETKARLPNGWIACNLADATEPYRARGNPGEFVGQAYIGLENIEAHTTNLLSIVPAETMRSSGVKFHKGDVLYGRMRPYLNKVWLADRNGLCSGEFIVFPSSGVLRGRFLKYRLNAQDFVAYSDYTTTGDRPRADFNDLGKFPILVPPLAEQERIADRLDELFTDLSAGVVALERVKRKLARYRVAVLHAAVTGRLTEEWREKHGPAEEPGSKLLERILVERRRQWEQRTLQQYEQKEKTPPKNWRDNYKPPQQVNLAIQEDMPASWAMTAFDSLVTSSTNGFVKRSQQAGVPHIVLRLADIQNGEITTSNVRRINATEMEAESYALQKNDILVIRVNGSADLVGRFIVANNFKELVLYCDHFIRIRCVMPAMADFIRFFAETYAARNYIDQNKVCSAGQNTISQSLLLNLSIPLPPLEEQMAIIEIAKKKIAEINTLEAETERNFLKINRLRQSILKAAFEGALLPQEIDDAPAIDLLNHINNESQAAPGYTRTKNKNSRKIRSL